MVTVGAMKMIVRLRLNTTYLNEVLVMKDQFDAASAKSLAAFKQQGGSGYEWWRFIKSSAKLVLQEDITTGAFNENHDLADVVGHVDICVESSEVGRRLFEKAQGQVLSDRL